MYINPILVGVVGTLLAETAIVIIITILANRKDK